MTIDPFWVHIVAGFAVVIVAYLMHMRTLRLKATFDLYRVRDMFVLLVANGTLSEEGRVFTHYYTRINSLLKQAPNVGVDDMLQAIFHSFKPGKFDQTLAAASGRIRKLATDQEMESPEVRRAVAAYYSGIQCLILSHSSAIKVAYLMSQHLVFPAIAERCACSLHKAWAMVAPRSINEGLQALRYAAKEENEFRPV